MELAPTSVNERLRHVVELAEYQLRKGRVEVHYDLDPSDPFVMADAFQVDQLFLNLVLNAGQAMPDGGKLTLSTRRNGNWIVAEVADTGVGIPEEMRERIFDPFFTTRDVGEGTGLGLTVSDSIVSSHGGKIEVRSVAGSGSAFRISFPKLSSRTLERSHGDGFETTATGR
jgi:signal transduction histidine kinase